MTPSRGVALFNRGDYAGAAAVFEADLQRGPLREWVVCALGQAYAASGRVPDALRLLRRAAGEVRDPHPVYLAISDILRRAGQEDRAEAVLRRLAAESSRLGQAHHALGQLLLSRGRAAAAEECFRKAARLEPGLPWPHMALGELMDKRGRLDEARRLWARAGRARHCDAAVALRLGELYERRGLGREAGRQYLRAWRRGGDPGVAACQKLADAAKARGDLRGAALWLTRAGRLAPREALWDFRLGWIHGQAGRWAEMRRCLRRYLGRLPAGARDGVSPVLAWVSLGDYRRAAAAAERVLDALGPDDISLLSRAWPENWLRQHEESFYARHLAAVERQARALPRSPWPVFFRAALFLRRNRYADSGAQAAALARFPRRYGWMRYVTGLALLLDCRYAQAVREFAAALDSRPRDWKARCHLAETLLCLGRRAEAFAQFDRAEADAARGGAACEVWAWRGEARLWLGEAAALADLDRAMQANARLALCWRGAARLRAGCSAAALQDLDRAIVPDSRDSEALLWRAELHRRAGRPREALRDLEAARRAGHGQEDCEWAACNRALLPGAAAGAALHRLQPGLLAAAGAALSLPVPEPGDEERTRGFARAWLARARGLRRHEPYLRALWLGPEESARLARLCDAAPAVRLGDLCTGRGRPREAELQYRRAWRLGRSVAACQKLAERAKSLGRLGEAAVWLERAARLEPREPLWDFRLGWIYGQEGRWERMRSCLRRYLSRRRGHDGVSPVLAWVCLRDYRRAAVEAERLVGGLDPDAVAALMRAWPENWLRPHGDAFYAGHLRALERQARALPRSPWFVFFRAALLLRRDRPAEAGAQAAVLARFPRRYGWMRYATGLALLLACCYEDAVRELRAALASRPGDWQARGHLAEALLCLGRRAEAFAQFDRAETAAARLGSAREARAWRGEARLWLGESAAALADLDPAVAAGAKLALCWRGAARLLCGRSAEARKDLDGALVPGSRDAEAFLWRAELNRREGRAGAALRDLEASRRAGLGQQDCEWAACNRALLTGARDAFRHLPPGLLAAAAERLGRPVPEAGDASGTRLFARDWLARARGLRRYEPYLRALWLGPEAAGRLSRP